MIYSHNFVIFCIQVKPQITTTSPSCRDKDPNTCLQFGADLCTRFVDYAKANCPARCGLCGIVLTTSFPGINVC